MTDTIRPVQTGPQTYVVRCPLHGDVSTHPSGITASLACIIHAVFVFHGEGAR